VIWKFVLPAILAAAVLVLAACGTEETGPVPGDDPEGVDDTVVMSEDDSEFGDDVDPDAIVLEPDAIYLVSASGEQRGELGSYDWMDVSGLAAESEASGFPIPEEPLAIVQGEEVRFETRSGLFPKLLEIELYDYDSNITEDISTQEGRMDAFQRLEDPVVENRITDPDDPLEWVVDVEPGDYFVYIYTEWPDPALPTPEAGTPEALEEPRSAAFAFRIVVERPDGP
jgi:hypothetical protein